MPRKTTPDDTFVEFICDQLEDLEAITHRAMFGGYGLYCGNRFFGLVFRDRLYFKTDEDTRKKYEEWDMGPFQTKAKRTLKSYYEVPADYIDEAARLVELAAEAVTVAAAG